MSNSQLRRCSSVSYRLQDIWNGRQAFVRFFLFCDNRKLYTAEECAVSSSKLASKRAELKQIISAIPSSHLFCFLFTALVATGSEGMRQDRQGTVCWSFFKENEKSRAATLGTCGRGR